MYECEIISNLISEKIKKETEKQNVCFFWTRSNNCQIQLYTDIVLTFKD